VDRLMDVEVLLARKGFRTKRTNVLFDLQVVRVYMTH